jgi:riboflavin synthase
MFTGIIIALGTILGIEDLGGDRRITIEAAALPLVQVNIGDSIAVNGVCLTVISKTDHSFSVDVSVETLARTSLADIQIGALLNLELSLTPSTPLGGHIVSGHVDGLAKIVALQEAARSWQVTFEVPQELTKFIAQKGSICVDGVSLTVNAVQGNQFEVMIIPHTYENTLFHTYQVGSQVNIEVDMLARYVARLQEVQS